MRTSSVDDLVVIGIENPSPATYKTIETSKYKSPRHSSVTIDKAKSTRHERVSKTNLIDFGDV